MERPRCWGRKNERWGTAQPEDGVGADLRRHHECQWLPCPCLCRLWGFKGSNLPRGIYQSFSAGRKRGRGGLTPEMFVSCGSGITKELYWLRDGDFSHLCTSHSLPMRLSWDRKRSRHFFFLTVGKDARKYDWG